MTHELITDRPDLMIRRQVLPPGEAGPWHVDLCHRFSVVIRGERLRIEFADGSEPLEFEVWPGQADWDAPESRAHRAVNVGSGVYEEVVTFWREPAGCDPQPAP